MVLRWDLICHSEWNLDVWLVQTCHLALPVPILWPCEVHFPVCLHGSHLDLQENHQDHVLWFWIQIWFLGLDITLWKIAWFERCVYLLFWWLLVHLSFVWWGLKLWGLAVLNGRWWKNMIKVCRVKRGCWHWVVWVIATYWTWPWRSSNLRCAKRRWQDIIRSWCQPTTGGMNDPGLPPEFGAGTGILISLGNSLSKVWISIVGVFLIMVSVCIPVIITALLSRVWKTKTKKNHQTGVSSSNSSSP